MFFEITIIHFDHAYCKPSVHKEATIVRDMSLIMMLTASIFLPCSSISVELYYIFATVWGREVYTLYGILLVVFLILISVTCCISITLTYFVLSAEDYRWWWRSVFNVG